MRNAAVRAVLAGASLAGLLANAPAFADWTPVTTDDGIHAAFADPATIRRRGAIASMQGLYNFSRRDLTPDGRPFLSTTVLREYDCAERKVRLLSFADHAEHFGAGDVVSAVHRVRPWETIVEGGVDDAFWRVACRPD